MTDEKDAQEQQQKVAPNRVTDASLTRTPPLRAPLYAVSGLAEMRARAIILTPNGDLSVKTNKSFIPHANFVRSCLKQLTRLRLISVFKTIYTKNPIYMMGFWGFGEIGRAHV